MIDLWVIFIFVVCSSGFGMDGALYMSVDRVGNHMEGSGMKDKRQIVDGGGYSRGMELIYENEGIKIYREIRGTTLCVFWEYDSLDESGNWFEDFKSFVESQPDADRDDWVKLFGFLE